MPCMFRRNVLYPLKYELSAYQHEACDFIRRHEHIRNTTNSGALVVMRMGLGKTLCALNCTSMSLRHQQTLRQQTLYVSVANTIIDVYRQCRKFFPVHITSYILNYNINRTKIKYATQNTHLDFNLKSADIVIISYATLRSLWLCRRNQNKYRDYIFKRTWYRIVFDESHILMSGDTKLYHSVLQLKATRKFAMTGTVMRNTIYDVLYQLHALNIVNSIFKNRDTLSVIDGITQFWDFDALDVDVHLDYIEYRTNVAESIVGFIRKISDSNDEKRRVTLIFCSNPIVINTVKNRIRNASKLSVISHSDSLKKRSNIIQSHHQSFIAPFVIINTCIAMYGIDLSFASNILFTDTCNNDPICIQQCVYRVKRPGFKYAILPITCIVRYHSSDRVIMCKNILKRDSD